MDEHATLTLIERQIARMGRTLAVVCNLKASCDYVVFSPLLTGQVGKSFAAHAFNPLQVVLIESVLLRVISLWDEPLDKDVEHSNTFPAAAKLLARDDLQRVILKRCKARILSGDVVNLNLTPDGLETLRVSASVEACTHYRREIYSILEEIEAVSKGAAYSNLKNHRSKHIAHSLERTRTDVRRERDSMQALPQPKFNELDEIVECSLKLHARLQSAVTGAYEDWSVWIDQCKRNARYLWEGMKIAPLA